MSEFNDYLFDYFSHKEELDMSDSTREMLEDCFYRKQKEIKKLKTQLKEAEKVIEKCLNKLENCEGVDANTVALYVYREILKYKVKE